MARVHLHSPTFTDKIVNTQNKQEFGNVSFQTFCWHLSRFLTGILGRYPNCFTVGRGLLSLNILLHQHIHSNSSLETALEQSEHSCSVNIRLCMVLGTSDSHVLESHTRKNVWQGFPRHSFACDPFCTLLGSFFPPLPPLILQ